MASTSVLSLNGKPQLVLRDGDHEPVPVDAASSASSASTAAQAGEATRRVMALVGAILRVKISDGRVLVGGFHCFDAHQNVILTDAREYLPLRPLVTAKEGKRGKDKDKDKEKEKDQALAISEEQEEARELWKTGSSRSLGMALVPGKHIVYIKVERAAYTRSEPPIESEGDAL